MEINYLKAIEAAILAGKEILEIYGSDNFQIENKLDDTPLTIADKRANKVILEILSSTDIPIISEETKQLPFSERKTWEKCWIVDPLDGTKEFIKRNGEFTVNIALIERGNPVFGVIYVPVTEELYWGNVAARKSFKIKINSVNDLEQQLVKAKEINPKRSKDILKVVGSRSHMNQETLDYIEEIKKQNNCEVEIVSKGSSLKFCLVAEGLADVYPRFAPTMEWDTAAGQAICKAVGLQVMDKETNKDLRYNKEQLLNSHFLITNLNTLS